MLFSLNQTKTFTASSREICQDGRGGSGSGIGGGGDKAGTAIDDDWVVRKITHIRRRSRSIDSALGETPGVFPSREEQNTVTSSPTQDKLASSSTALRRCSGSGADYGGGGGDGGGDTRDKERVMMEGDSRRAGVGPAVSGDARSFVLGEIGSNSFRKAERYALVVEDQPIRLRSS